MPKKNSLSDFEWMIMNIVWDSKNISAREVFEIISQEKPRAYTTIQTYLERLTAKGFLQKKKIGLVNFYSPKIQADEVLQKETKHFMQNAFNGSFSQFAAFLFKTESIDDKDIEKLKAMINQKEAQDG